MACKDVSLWAEINKTLFFYFYFIKFLSLQ